MQGTAFDIAMSNHDPVAFEAAARAVASSALAPIPARASCTSTSGLPAWGDPFAPRAVPFVPELPPAREVLADSRTLKGGGRQASPPLAPPVSKSLQEVLAETQSAILPLVPYLDTLRWVFIAVALIGIAVTIHARIDDWKRGQR
jgi:zinc D-Ala-D-Ala carboxypeptidase